jgi:hypothetical protein
MLTGRQFSDEETNQWMRLEELMLTGRQVSDEETNQWEWTEPQWCRGL